jgi:hypothetical protein
MAPQPKSAHRAGFAAQLRQVAITYLTHRYLVAVGLFFVLILAAPSLIAISRRPEITKEAAGPVSMMLGMPLLFGIFFFVGHAKTQFGHWRSVLIPRFSPPHITVLAVELLVVLVLYPALIASCAHISPLGLIAFAVAIATPMIWAAHLSRAWHVLLGLIVFYSIYTEAGANLWLLHAADHTAILAAIVAGGLVAIAAWLRRLTQLREEMDDFRTNVHWNIARPGTGEASEQRRLLAIQATRSPLMSWIADKWLARLENVQSPGALFRLPRLLGFGFGPWHAEIQAVFTTLLIGAATIFLVKFTTLADGDNSGALNVMIYCCCFMPGFLNGETLAGRRSRLAAELMRPVARRELIDGVFRASARNVAVSWLITNAGLLLVAQYTMGEQLTPRVVAKYLIFSIPTCLATWAFSLRLAVWRSQFARLFAATLIFSGTAALVARLVANGHIHAWSVPIATAVVLLVLAVPFIAIARRTWLELELG